MDDARHDRIDDIFLAALDRPEADRSDYVAEACNGDSAIRAEVMELLAGHARADEVVPEPRAQDGHHAATPTELSADHHAIVRRIGPYRVERILGEGGMGMVYLAEQERPKRLVALKVVRPGVATPKMLRRFEQESQVLGRLQHPGIAQIYEAGTADTGGGPQPYFVMEYVRGQPLLDYAKMRHFGTRERLELLTRICDAVQHAHRRGIIHRDLKPANILVTDDGQPKILDFGVARATDADIQTVTLHTDIGQLVGTVPYMSPEQTAGDPEELDTRSDVYALGVIGYELLAGRLPYDISKKLIHEAVRIIREDAPTPLSTVDRVFRGDVDTIFTKALSKEPSRRYQSVSELAGDISRYLHDEPIEARRPSIAYQVRLFARRQKALFGAIAAVIGVMVLATVVSVTFGIKASIAGRQSELEANARAEEAEHRRVAELEARDAAAMAERQRAEAVWQAYVASIAAAEASLQSNLLLDAQDLLETAPEFHRNWEWRHLANRADPSVESMRASAFGVHRLEFLPDGRRLFAIDILGAIRLWDTSTGEVLATYGGRPEVSDGEAPAAYVAFAISPDGSHVALSNYTEKTITIREIDSNRVIRTFTDVDTVHTLAYCPDGSRLAAASEHEVIVWNASSGDVIGRLRGHEDSVYVITFSPDSSMVATGSTDQTIRLWDVASGVETRALRGHDEGVWYVAFSQDGSQLISTSNDQTCRWWDVSTGKQLKSFGTDLDETFFAIEVSPDGAVVAVCAENGGLHLFDVESLEELCSIRGHQGDVWAAAFSPDGARIASANDSGTIRIWDVGTTVQPTASLSPAGEANWVIFTPDGRRLISKKGEIGIHDALTGERLATLQGHTDAVWSLGVSPDNALLATGSRDKTIRLWNLDTGAALAVLEGHPATVWAVEFYSDGRRLASMSRDGTMCTWDTSTGDQLTKLTVPYEGQFEANLLPGGDRYIVELWGGSIGIGETETGLESMRLEGLDGYTEFISKAVSPDGEYLVLGLWDSDIRVWELATQKQIAILRGHTRFVNSVEFSSDGTRLVSGSDDGTVRLWDTASWRPVATLHGPGGGVLTASLSPDDTRLASVWTDHTIRIWDTLPPHEREHQRREAQQAAALARPIVDHLFETVNEPDEIVARIRGEASLSEDLRRAAFDLVLKRCDERRRAHEAE